MSDLVRRLRMRAAAVSAKLKPSKFDGYDVGLDIETADRIEHLERELAARSEQWDFDKLQAELAAEKALADRLYKSPYDRDEEGSRAAYRKARGM